eukprot:350208-Chlamydomonas_euryale.AAC.13
MTDTMHAAVRAMHAAVRAMHAAVRAMRDTMHVHMGNGRASAVWWGLAGGRSPPALRFSCAALKGKLAGCLRLLASFNTGIPNWVRSL